MNDRHDDHEPRPEHHSRMETEILEILDRAEQSETLTDSLRRRVRQPNLRHRRGRWDWLKARFADLGDTGMIIGSFIVAIVALLVSGASPLLAKVLAIVSMALLLAPIVLFNTGPHHPTSKMWRGRDIDVRPDPPDWVGSIRDRFRRPPRR